VYSSEYTRYLTSITFFFGIKNKTSDFNLTDFNITFSINSWDPESLNTVDQDTSLTQIYQQTIDFTSSDTVVTELTNLNSSYTNSVYKVVISNLDANMFTSHFCIDGDVYYGILVKESSRVSGTEDNVLITYLQGASSDDYEKAYTIDDNNECTVSTQVSTMILGNVYKNFIMTPTGRVNLVGERFIVLRCPEIESQQGLSIGFGSNAAGLGLFKLAVLGYADARFDFTSIQPQEFHPIGKLSKLSLRFETAQQKLYDFKGMNHHLLVVVKFYQPIHKPLEGEERRKKYVLNPNYNPDLYQYNQNIVEAELNDEEDDEDDENLLSKNFEKVFYSRQLQPDF
jgi:hypothetical protein